MGNINSFCMLLWFKSNFKYLFATSVKCSDYTISPLVHKLAKTYPFRDRGFHTFVEWKIGYKVINKKVIIQMLIVNTAFYMYDSITLKEISIMNSFEEIQENTRLFWLGSAARPWLSYPTDFSSSVISDNDQS